MEGAAGAREIAPGFIQKVRSGSGATIPGGNGCGFRPPEISAISDSDNSSSFLFAGTGFVSLMIFSFVALRTSGLCASYVT